MRKLMGKVLKTRKKGYIVPRLVKYGNAVAVVKTGGTTQFDGNGDKRHC